jgi:hypothetical protein
MPVKVNNASKSHHTVPERTQSSTTPENRNQKAAPRLALAPKLQASDAAASGGTLEPSGVETDVMSRLTDALSTARMEFGYALRKRGENQVWFSTSDFHDNVDTFELLKKKWQEGVHAAIDTGFRQLLTIRSRCRPGIERRLTVNETAEMVRTVMRKSCGLLETFKTNSFSCLDTVGDGIADGETTEEFAGKLEQSVYTYLKGLETDALIDIDLKADSIDRIPESFGYVFLKKCNALQKSSIDDVSETIHRGSETISNEDAVFEFKHESLHSGLVAWLASIGRLVHEQVTVLTQIAAKGSGSYCENGQEPHWARIEVESLLLQSLRQDSACGKAWIDADFSAVHYWSRTICEDNPVPSLAETWCAPAWYERWTNAELWIKEGRPQRLTVQNTENAVELYQSWVSSQLQEDLNNAEHDARVELAAGRVFFPTDNSQPESGISDQLLIQSGLSPQDRKQLIDPILTRKGWSIHDWAVQSEVDFHTANDYLMGKTNPFRSTRKKLATSLGVAVETLPR